MSFKKENFSTLGTFKAVLFLLLANIVTGSAQEACPIWTAVEPLATHSTRAANSYSQTSFPLFQSWDSLENIATSNNQYARVELNSYKRSTKLNANNLNLNIPTGAEIHGIEVIVEGRTIGEGYIRETDMRLTANGMPIGESKIGFGGIQAWSNDTTDVVWSYGRENDTWDAGLTADMLSSLDFGYQLQIRNSQSQAMEVLIDHISVKVYYTPLYSICDHTCVTFYVDSLADEDITYNWILPQGFELLSFSEKAAIINLGVTYADFGTYNLCVETLDQGNVIGTCCRLYNFEDCDPGSIGDMVWEDLNPNGIFDTDDQALSGVTVQLYDPAQNLIATQITDDNGLYRFTNVTQGDYYIQVDMPQGYVPVFAGIGNEDIDNDITSRQEPFTSDLITIAAGDSLSNIDIGLSQYIHLGDLVWEDLNGDGIYQETEPGIAGVEVTFTSDLGPSFSTTTDEEGEYLIGPLPQGSYTGSFSGDSTLTPTLINIGDPLTDSDIDADGSTGSILYNEVGFNKTIDAGFFRAAIIGDFVWEDLNLNGLQDEGEPGLAGIKVALLSGTTLIDSVITDENGLYTFITAPGEYSLRLSETGLFSATITGTGTNAYTDSNLEKVDEELVTQLFILVSGEVRNDIDLGLINAPSTIGGLTWADTNADGIKTEEEPTIQNIGVQLYAADGTLIDETVTDSDGAYMFEDIFAGEHYLSFNKADIQLFTLANVGNDDTDSDVTGAINSNSTDVFSILPGVDDFSYWAGYTVKPSIGDRVYIDLNRNGNIDAGELGFDDVLVSLIDENGVAVASQLTGSDDGNGLGFYLFEFVNPGTYTVTFEVDDFFEFTEPNNGAEDIDSDVVDAAPTANSTLIGTTASFTVAANDINLDIDAGLLLPFGGVTGKVFVDADGNGLRENEALLGGVTVTLFDESQTEIANTTTDTTGFYGFINVPAGSYYVTFGITDRYIFTTADAGDDMIDSDVTESVILGSTDLFPVLDGFVQADIDAGVIDGISNISGLAWVDLNGDGIRTVDEPFIADVDVTLHTTLGVEVETTTTDANGQYTFEAVEEGQYYIVFDPTFADEQLVNTEADQGGDDTIDDDVTNAFVTGSTTTLTVNFFENIENVDAGYYKLSSVGDQTFIDLNENSLRDMDEVGIDGIIVRLLDEAGTTLMTTTTAAGGGLDSGFYFLDGIEPGRYQLEFERVPFYIFVEGDAGDDTLDSDVITVEANTGRTAFFNLTSGTHRVDLDAGLVFSAPTESSIAGTIFDDVNADGLSTGDLRIASRLVELYDTDDNLLASMLTDENGAYQFNMLGEGFYYVKTIIPTDRVATLPNVGNDDTMDSEGTNANGKGTTDLFFLSVFENLEGIDIGEVNELTIGNFVWEDTNVNGIQDIDENGVPAVKIFIESEGGNFIDSTVTDENGAYAFANLPAHSYRLTFVSPAGSFFTEQDAGTADNNSDVNVTGETGQLDFTAGGLRDDIDAGILRSGSIRGRTWVDFNANGRQNGNEPGLNEIGVSLFDENNIFIAAALTQDTDEDSGFYEFLDIKPGSYYIMFDIPVQSIITDANVGNEDEDSDITNTIGYGSTDLFTVGSSVITDNVDGGAYEPASLGDRVWLDENMDGIQDENEPGVEGIEVILFRSFGLAIDTVVTDENGFYTFGQLKQGLYFIDFEIPEMFMVSTMDASGDETNDSDADETGVTPLVSLAHGAVLNDIDCGIFESSVTLRSIAWDDANADGLRQQDEGRIDNLKVELMDEQGQVVATTLTNTLGKYAFNNLENGEYYVHVPLGQVNYSHTLPNVGSDDMMDSDIMMDGSSEMFMAENGLSVPNVDIGLFVPGLLVAEVWDDENKDGTYNLGEYALGNIKAELYNEENELVDTKMSKRDVYENVKFTGLWPGEYYIKYTAGAEYEGSTSNEIGRNPDNSDLVKNGKYYYTPTVEIKSRSTVDWIDAGFYEKEVTAFANKGFELIEDKAPNLDVSVGPNPALYFVEISDESIEKGTELYTLLLSDRNGNILNTISTPTLDRYKLLLDGLHSGTYYLSINQGQRTVSKKILKITP